MYVFISHKQEDQVPARQLSNWLESIGIPNYLDVKDVQMQMIEDKTQILEKVEREISRSTHIIGIFSKKTKDSWWVPFEIGVARASQTEIGHLILEDVQSLPDYLCVSKDIQTTIELASWIQKYSGVKLSSSPPSIHRLPRVRYRRASLK